MWSNEAIGGAVALTGDTVRITSTAAVSKLRYLIPDIYTVIGMKCHINKVKIKRWFSGRCYMMAADW